MALLARPRSASPSATRGVGRSSLARRRASCMGGYKPEPGWLASPSVAGPPTPLYVAGARALTYAPVSIPYHGCALNITVYSYDGKLFFGLTGARSALPDLRDLAEGVKLEIDLLTRHRRKARAR